MGDTIRLVRGSSTSTAPTAQKHKSNFFKKHSLKTLLVLLGIPLSILCYNWFFATLFYVTTENSYIQKEIFPVSSRIMGYVKEIKVEEGMKVKAGDPLLFLDDSDFQIELSFKQSKYDATLADVQRARALNKTNAVSRSDLERAESLLIANKADLDGTLAKIKYTHVYSPTTGTIAKKSAQPGQFVQPGQGLVIIVQDANTWVKANIKETQITHIQAGMKAEIEVDAFPGISWTGTVKSIFPASGATLSLLPPENATGNFTKIIQNIPIKIVIDTNQPHAKAQEFLSELKPGMSAITTIRFR